MLVTLSIGGLDYREEQEKVALYFELGRILPL